MRQALWHTFGVERQSYILLLQAERRYPWKILFDRDIGVDFHGFRLLIGEEVVPCHLISSVDGILIEFDRSNGPFTPKFLGGKASRLIHSTISECRHQIT
jgi:hypothetical protein